MSLFLKNVVGRGSALVRPRRVDPLVLGTRTFFQKPFFKVKNRNVDLERFAYPKELASVVDTKSTTLSNGLRVVSVNLDQMTAVVGVFIDSGSRNENLDNNGAAHFLEHMAFKGTKTRSKEDIEIEVENMGAMLNAYTSREMTVYYIASDKDSIDKSLNIMSDILQNSTFPDQALKRERYVISREMEEVYQSPDELLFDNLHEAVFKNTPLSMTILGPLKNIMKMSGQDIRNYIDENYSCDRIAICGIGGVDHNDLVQRAEKYFSAFPAVAKNHNLAKSVYTSGEIRTATTDFPLAHVGIAFKGVSWSDPNFFTLQLITTLIGNFNRMNGGSFQDDFTGIVAKNELAHSFLSYVTCYTDTGLWGIVFGTEPEKAGAMIACFQDELARIATSVTDAEVDRAKQILKSGVTSLLDNNTQSLEELGRQILTLGRRVPPEEMVERIEAIDTKLVKQVLSGMLKGDELGLSVIGNIEGVPSYDEILTRQKKIFNFI